MRRRRRTACKATTEDGCWELLIWLSAGLAATALVTGVIHWLGVVRIIR